MIIIIEILLYFVFQSFSQLLNEIRMDKAVLAADNETHSMLIEFRFKILSKQILKKKL